MTSFLQNKAYLIILIFSVIHVNSLAYALDLSLGIDAVMEKKLSHREMIASTRYYARGPTFIKAQKWNEEAFLKALTQQNYRIRDSQQNLMAGDIQKLNSDECNSILAPETIPQSAFCWQWQTHNNEFFTLAIDENKIILNTFKGQPPKPYWKASLDPILVAQYRGTEPIMQNELKISEIPVQCLNAVMSIEDNDFLDHSGVSYSGLARAFIKNIIKMRAAQGGSTITQQLVKNYFLTPEKTLKRKLKEFYLATRVEADWTKDEILETYLNIIYMGQVGAFQVRGFGAASNVYFNKPLQNLELHECALLAAIINNPALNNPWKKAEQAKNRRHLVLTKMKDLKLITDTEFNKATEAPLPAQVLQKATETAPYFFEAVRQQIQKLGLLTEGVKIETSLDLEAQSRAQKALQNHISDLEQKKKNLISNKEKGIRLEGLVISSENSTGLVNVLVGGQSYRQTQFNRALDGHRQIGSLIKPLVYLSALINGFQEDKETNQSLDSNVNPLTLINDVKFDWKFDKKTWSPTNSDKKFHGEIPLYFALKESLNSPTAQVAKKVGIEKIIDLAKSVGFTSKMDVAPATSLGASEHYPLEIIEAYRTLALLGVHTESSFIEKISDKENNIQYEFIPKNEKKLDETQVAVLVGMMKETLKSGTAKSSSAYGWKTPSAGKTGTTSNNKDAWFAGFTPFQTSVVWLGYDQSLSSKLTGSSGSVPVWIELMKYYQSIWPEDDFKWPESVEKKEVPLHETDLKTELIFKK